ncbi:MAG: hypothetical protein ACYS8Z_01450 [Planctomycetota bacterium]|jgi:hypothetical protein
MNDFDFDELIGVLKTGSADASFQEQLLLKSQSTLVRGRAARHIVRATVVSSCLLLLVVGAFACGRFTADGRTRDVTIADTADNIAVSAELVAWLDAGRFFECIGMQDRAVKAYKKASKLIPAEKIDRQATDTSGTTQLASLLQRAETVATGKTDNEKAKGAEWTGSMLGTISTEQ